MYVPTAYNAEESYFVMHTQYLSESVSATLAEQTGRLQPHLSTRAHVTTVPTLSRA